LAYPDIRQYAYAEYETAITSHDIDLPVLVSEGDLLLVFFLSNGSRTCTLPTGWTKVGDDEYSSYLKLTVAARVADGTEGGDTVTFTTSGTTGSSIHAYSISGFSGTISTDIDFSAAHSETTAFGVGLTAGWGSDDNLWFAILCLNGVTGHSVTQPTGFSSTLRADGWDSLFSCDDELATGSLSSSTEWSTTTTTHGIVAMVVIKPEEAVDELTSQDIATTPAIDKPTAGHTHVLTSQDIVAATAVDKSDISSGLLSAPDIIATPSVAQTSIEQVHELACADIVSTPAIDALMLNPLELEDIAVTPVVDQPSLTENLTMIASDVGYAVRTESPFIGLDDELSMMVSDVSYVTRSETPMLGFATYILSVSEVFITVREENPVVRLYPMAMTVTGVNYGVSISQADMNPGPLPLGVEFEDNADGTGTFSGTPADRTAGVYKATLTVTDDNGSEEREFTIRVNA